MKNNDEFNLKPLISIITVVYNGEKYLEETIQSVLNQTYENIEYIIIDGGSSDGTVDIIKKFADSIDYWISEKDSGIYDAMNKGIKVSSGEIIGIVNADDYLFKNTIEEVLKSIEKTNSDFTYGNLDIIDLEGNFLSKTSSLGIDSIKYKLFNQMPFLHPTMFIKRKVYEKIGLYNLEYKLSADYDFVLRLIESKYKPAKLNFSTGVFRLGGQSGGIETFMENHKLLLNHKFNPILVYFNTIVLITKFYIRKILSR